MFCNHDHEADVYGADPVPCPLCGFGGHEEASSSDDREASGVMDSNDALRNALFETDQTQASSDLERYW